MTTKHPDQAAATTPKASCTRLRDYTHVELRFGDSGRVAAATVSAGVTDEELEILSSMLRSFVKRSRDLEAKEAVN